MEQVKQKSFDLQNDLARLFELEDKAFRPARKKWYKTMHQTFSVAISPFWDEIKEKLKDNGR